MRLLLRYSAIAVVWGSMVTVGCGSESGDGDESDDEESGGTAGATRGGSGGMTGGAGGRSGGGTGGTTSGTGGSDIDQCGLWRYGCMQCLSMFCGTQGQACNTDAACAVAANTILPCVCNDDRPLSQCIAVLSTDGTVGQALYACLTANCTTQCAL